MLEAVIFDMDGLMFDTEGIWAECWEPALTEMGLPMKEGIAEATRGTAGKEFLRIVYDWFGEDIDAERLWDIWHGLAEERFMQGVEKKPGLDELLACLDEQGLPAAVASSSLRNQIERNLSNAGISSSFAVTVSGLEVAHAKPEPDVFLKAAELLGSSPAHTLVLEDSFNGVRAGVAGGFITIMVPDLMQPDEEMRSIASRICGSLFEVRDLIEAGAID